MADNLDPQQIDDLNRNLQSLNETLSKASGTKATGPSLGGSGGISDILGISKKTAGTLDALGTGAGSLTKALYKGEKGAQVFTNALEAMSVAIMLIPGLGAAAKIASVVLYAFAKSVGAVTKQGDALYKTYQDLQRSGATAADGITGVFNNMQQFGYGIEELDKMVKLVTENSETLAKFSLTAASGTSEFSTAMKDLVRDEGLKVLGKTPDDINAAGAAFIRQTVRAGISQREVGGKLEAQTLKYVYDLDRLQRLTGLSADQLQKQQDEAMAEDAYNDVVSELKQRALAGDEVAQAQLNKINSVMAKLGPEMRKEFIMSIGGDISAGQKLFMTVPSLMRNTMDETVSLADTMNDANRDVTRSVNTFGKTFRYGASSMRESFIGLAEQREFMTGTADFDERVDAAKREAVVTDEATKNLSKINLEQMNSRDALQSFVKLGIAPATKALAGLSDVVTGGTRMLPGAGLGGANSVGNKLDMLGGKAPATGTQKEFLDSMYKTLLDEAKKQGVKNPEVIAKLGASQSALETGYGKSLAGGNNYFGIKARPGEGGSGMATQEFVNGKMVTVNDKFRKYGSMQESAADYVKFLQENKRYKDVLKAESLGEAISAQSKTGYATDPNYGAKLSSIAGKINGDTKTANSNKTEDLQKMTSAMNQLNATTATEFKRKSAGDLQQMASIITSPVNKLNEKFSAMTGPTDRFDSKLAEVKADKTLPPKEAAAAAANAPVQDFTDQFMEQLGSKLDSLHSAFQDVADNTKKTAQYASR